MQCSQITSFSFPDGITMTDFVHYLFTRRYGWSEAMPHGRAMKVQRIPGQGSTSHQEGQMKAQLNELLDEFLKWYISIKIKDLKMSYLNDYPRVHSL